MTELYAYHAIKVSVKNVLTNLKIIMINVWSAIVNLIKLDKYVDSKFNVYNAYNMFAKIIISNAKINYSFMMTIFSI